MTEMYKHRHEEDIHFPKVAEVEQCLAESEQFANIIHEKLGRIEHA